MQLSMSSRAGVTTGQFSPREPHTGYRSQVQHPQAARTIHWTHWPRGTLQLPLIIVSKIGLETNTNLAPTWYPAALDAVFPALSPLLLPPTSSDICCSAKACAASTRMPFPYLIISNSGSSKTTRKWVGPLHCCVPYGAVGRSEPAGRETNGSKRPKVPQLRACA